MHNLMMIVFYGTTGDSEQGADITSRSDRKKRKEPVGKERRSHPNKNKIDLKTVQVNINISSKH